MPEHFACHAANSSGSRSVTSNLWNPDDLSERFFSGKTGALHGTHVGTGDRLWRTSLSLRLTISHDTLSWYGRDSDGARIHDVIGTRCDRIRISY